MLRYGLHETLEAVLRDQDSEGLYRHQDYGELGHVRAVVESAIKQGLRYGMQMRATIVETN